MVDYTDDWMNQNSDFRSWSPPKPEDKDEFVIERARRVVCFGSPGSMTRWDAWGIPYATKKERDDEMERLSKEHPMWHLRGRTRNRWREMHGLYPPESHPGIND